MGLNWGGGGGGEEGIERLPGTTLPGKCGASSIVTDRVTPLWREGVCFSQTDLL